MSSPEAVGVGWTSCSVAAAAPHDDDPPAQRARDRRGRLTRSENETVSMVPGGPREVDPRAARRRAPRSARGARPTAPRGGHAPASPGPPADAAEALQHAARPGRQVAGAGVGAEGGEVLVAAEHVGVAMLVGLGGRRVRRCARAPTAAMRALSSRGFVCSVNCTS